MPASLIVRTVLLALLPPLLSVAALALPGQPPLPGVAAARADDDGPGGRDDWGDDRGFGGERDATGRDAFERDPFAREPRFAAGPEPRTPRGPRDHAPDEVLAGGLSEAQIAELQARGYRLLDQRRLAQIGLTTARLRIPRGTGLARALDEVRALAAASDRNHYYRTQGAACDGPACALRLVDWPGAARPCTVEARLGMIDTEVDLDHGALRASRIEVLTMRGTGRKAAGSAHGTAVASLLAGAADDRGPGLLPRARLVAVDAFHRGKGGEDRMDAFDLVAAIDALLERRVPVINLSFAGPANALLAAGVRAATDRGVLLVAAAGNDGPAAPVRYPAAYEGVLAVTAVGADLRVYRRAAQGAHIDLAAPGVAVWAASAGGAFKAHSGTSYATPYVTAAAALLLAGQPGAKAAERALTAAARDIGAPGRDPIFGNGLLQAAARCDGGMEKTGGRRE